MTAHPTPDPWDDEERRIALELVEAKAEIKRLQAENEFLVSELANALSNRWTVLEVLDGVERGRELAAWLRGTDDR